MICAVDVGFQIAKEGVDPFEFRQLIGMSAVPDWLVGASIGCDTAEASQSIRKNCARGGR